MEETLYITGQKAIVGFVVLKEPDGSVAVHPLGVKGMIESRDEDVEDVASSMPTGLSRGVIRMATETTTGRRWKSSRNIWRN